ncbi:MAG: sigma-70 family RNA polymerase sigma factor [Planctomycetes bacterium]|nr:sigma-70 family RNA polymerase sigma factor [Planctomycetota bacterium]
MARKPAPPQVTTADQIRELVHRLRRGDTQGPALFDQLYRDALLRFCWGYLGNMEEAEDAIQEIAYKVLTAGEIPDYFRPWVYKIARNHCRNLARDRGRRKDHQAVPADTNLHESLTGQLTRLVKEEQRVRMDELFHQLPDSFQEVLRLRYVEGLSRQEIAAVLDVEESAIKTRLFEGLRKLRNLAQGLSDTR